FIASGQEILVKSLVGEEKRLTRLAYAVPVGKRAVSVQVDDVSGVSGMLRPGDRVDVLGTFDVPGGAGQPFSGTTIFLQNIEVLAVGQSLSDAAPAEGGGAGGKYGTVTLAVTPADARPLTLVSERARIRLALRSPVDEGRAVVSPFEMRMLIGR
ncbi:MAG: Flp pilus assembly protein CpaB, partial [Firmicutes bacterium]|nr:Flp pilus assembly protein CpaB [Bacillota bacterium]